MLLGGRGDEDALLPSARSGRGRPLARRKVRSRDRSLGRWPDETSAGKLGAMISTNGNGRCMPVVSAARVAAAERFAGVIVSTFEKCEETNVPLSKAQKTTMIEAALVEFDGFEAELSSLMRIAELLSELGRNGYSHVEQETD
jgi:hypothetical protein